ncbi:MAG: GNAT family N-acetyltransferase [Pseudohongiellaceae bacterium]
MSECSDVKTRMAVDADLPHIQELYAAWGHAFVYLVNDQTFVAEVNGRIVGAVRLSFEETCFVVRSLFVLKNFRMQGIGKVLLEIVESELGQCEAYCLVPQGRQNLFSHIGFSPVTGLQAPEFLLSRKENLRQSSQELVLLKRSFGVQIRPLPANDLSRAMNLISELELTEERKLRENDIRGIYSKINAAGGAVLAAYRGSKIVGTCTLNVCANLSWSGRPYGVIENLIVTKDERSRGIGKSLLLFARRLAESKNCYKVTLMTKEKGSDSDSFYRSVGFSSDEIGYQRLSNP